MSQIIVTTHEELDNLIQKSVRKVLREQNPAPLLNEPEKFITVKEAAAYLNMAEQTLYTYTSKNLIPFFKPGKRVLFLKSELEKWQMKCKKLTIQETKAKLISEGVL